MSESVWISAGPVGHAVDVGETIRSSMLPLSLLRDPSDDSIEAQSARVQEAETFELVAKASELDMTLHPLHYLFLDPKTYLARRIWKAAIAYCAGVQALVDSVEKRKVTPEIVEKACVAFVGEMEFSMASEKLAESIRSDMRRVLEAALK